FLLMVDPADSIWLPSLALARRRRTLPDGDRNRGAIGDADSSGRVLFHDGPDIAAGAVDKRGDGAEHQPSSLQRLARLARGIAIQVRDDGRKRADGQAVGSDRHT